MPATRSGAGTSSSLEERRPLARVGEVVREQRAKRARVGDDDEDGAANADDEDGAANAGGAAADGPRLTRDAAGGVMRAPRARKFVRIAVPTTERERDAGVPEEYRTAELLAGARQAARERPGKALAEQSLEAYSSVWRRWFTWAFDDWISSGGPAEVDGEEVEGDAYAGELIVNPYALTPERVERFVHACLTPVLGEEGRTFKPSNMKLNRTALVCLGHAFAAMDAERCERERDKVHNVDPRAERARREAEVRFEAFCRDHRWRLAWPRDVAPVISGLGVWLQRKRDVTNVQREMGKGGVGTSAFNSNDALARSLDDRELNIVYEQLVATRSTSLAEYEKWARVRWFVLAAETFLTRPMELETLRLAQMRTQRYDGALGNDADLFCLEMSELKGSQDTTTPVVRFAIRNRDFRHCAISALAECLFIFFHKPGAKPLDIAARVSTAEYAEEIKNERTKIAFMERANESTFMRAWQLDLLCPGTKGSRVPPNLQNLRNSLRRKRQGEEPGLRDAICAKFHRRRFAVTKASSLGATEEDLRFLGCWTSADAMRDAYQLGPPPKGLMAQAACNAVVGLYYTDYDRDRLEVPESLLKRVFPWIEECERRADALERAKWAEFEGAPDVRIHSFLHLLKLIRRVLLQDFAFQRAEELEKIEREGVRGADNAKKAQANEEPPESWSMWTSEMARGVFVDDKGQDVPEWTALVADARQRMRGATIPERVRLSSDFIVNDVQRHMADTTRKVAETTRKVDAVRDDQRRLQAAVQALQEQNAEILELLRSGALRRTQDDVGPGVAGSLLHGVRAHTDPDPQTWEPLLKKVAPSKFEEDVNIACDAWAELAALKWQRTPSPVSDAKVRYALFYRAIDLWARSSSAQPDVARRRLYSIAGNLPAGKLAKLHAVFYEQLKAHRARRHQAGAGDDTKDDVHFVLDFVQRLEELVSGRADTLGY
jgi:hypothetical protein